MKVLKNNYIHEEEAKVAEVEVYPKQLICEECKSELEYEKSDIEIGMCGCAYLKCPLCGHDNFIDDSGLELVLTVDNVEFPKHFCHTSKENGAVDCCNNKNIKKEIRRAIEFFRNNKNDYDWYTETGNLRVDVSRYEGDQEYYVVVTNNYYSTHIPFETVDY